MSSEGHPPADPRLGAAIFATTHWTTVLSAKDGSEEASAAALARLCNTYWTPLYAFLRRDGCTTHDAEDLVQAFFARFLEREYIQDVDRTRGRFRSFLLSSLKHFVLNERRAAMREKRGGSRGHVSIDAPDEERLHGKEFGVAPTADEAFDRRWAMAVMQAAGTQLRTDYELAGKKEQYESLHAWLASDPSDGEYARLAERWNQSRGAVAVAVHRLRTRFRELIRNEVANTVQDPTEIDDEMRHLFKVMSVI